MNVLVAYATHHGATREIAQRIGAVLGELGLDVSVEQADRVRDVRRFDAFVVGSALYCGWLKEAVDFVQRNKAMLAGRPVWLFSSGPLGTGVQDEQGRAVAEAATPKEIAKLRETVHARDHHVFRGAYDPTAKPVGFLERTFRLVPKPAAMLQAGDFRDWVEISAWAQAIGDELTVARRADGWQTVDAGRPG
jgi:menaquinone-dependent protoporphyrinogen oxidase